jgi:eukaryotic-like serine/threonine-protein kinase
MGRSFTGLLLVCLCALIIGCSALQIPAPLSIGAYDATTYASAATRVNHIPVTLTPPLRLIWQQNLTGGIGAGSLLLVDNTIFVGNLRGELYGINTTTGKRYGWATFNGAIEGTPVIDRNVAVVPLAGASPSLIAYDLVDAKTVWKAELGDLHASPLLLDGRIYIGNVQGRFFAVDHATGATLWYFDLPHNTLYKGIRTSAAGLQSHVVFGADDGSVYNLDAVTGNLRWTYATDGAIQGAPAIADSCVFVGTLSGTVYALRLDSGKLLWSHAAGGAVYAPPMVHAGLCIFGTTAGTIVALSSRTGTSVWTCDVNAPVNTAVLSVKNLLYAGTLDRELFAIDPVAGSVVWRDTVSARIKTTPVAGPGALYIATDDRLVQAYREVGQ